jgi:UDPglucose 6-dehydrogenase
MKVTVFGTGYVGLVTGTCLAEMGNQVVCVDIDSAKVEGLNKGQIPIFEPGLTPMVVQNHQEGRLQFTTDAATAVAHGDIIFIAVGTPPDEDGSADLQYVLAVADTIGQHLTRYAVVVNKSTVPVGTADRVEATIAAALTARSADMPYDVVSNPEFLKEGDAVKDCMRPDRIVIGSKSVKALDLLKKLYAPFNRNHDRIVAMDVRSAELTKYAANAILATKISFMNEMANIAERVGADIEMVRHGIGSDPRIGYSFIYPGAGYGGSCFPKDVQALERTARQYGYEAQRPVETCWPACGMPAPKSRPLIRKQCTKPNEFSVCAMTSFWSEPPMPLCRMPMRWLWSPNGRISAVLISPSSNSSCRRPLCSMDATSMIPKPSSRPASPITVLAAVAASPGIPDHVR